MTQEKISEIVISTLKNHCQQNGIECELNAHTVLIGSNSLLNSLGLVSFIVDVETAFLEENIEISLTSESAMSSRISPFRSVGALCNFIANQIQNNG